MRTPTRRERPVLGWRGRTEVLGPRQSLLVLGPTQSGKTSGVVVPAILRWRGPVVVTSVKNDVVDATYAWRAAVGPVTVLNPAEGWSWDPLESVATWADAWRVASDLTRSPHANPSAEHDFWTSLAARVIAALFVAAREAGRRTHDVAVALARRVVPDWAYDVRDDTAAEVLRGVAGFESRTWDSIATTADAALTPWLTDAASLAIVPTVRAGGTVYLCAPRRDHRTWESLFRAALRAALDDHEREGREPLLVVLDEAASVAPLDDLDLLAATASGLGVTLVTVFQDVAQITSRFGDKAATIINNHVSRLVLSGSADASLTRYLPELEHATDRRGATTSPHSLRTLPPRRARLVSGHRVVVTLRLLPWWRWPRLRARGSRGRVAYDRLQPGRPPTGH